ncbi:2-oxoglutarate dehydrogenase complex dihydrolipoyllysine-residue succinyltransferase [Lacunimicrobium album]
MAIEIKVPPVGESISEVRIGEWYIAEGDSVPIDKELVGLETDKATFDVPAPVAGKITQIVMKAGETAQIGDVIAYIEAGAVSAAPAKSEPSAPASKSAAPAEKPAPAASSAGTQAAVMPAASRVLAEKGIPATSVQGTGRDGRVLKEDAIAAKAPSTALAAPRSNGDEVSIEADGTRTQRAVPMTPIRKKIAQRLVMAKQNAALLTTFNEIDMSAIKDIRNRYKDAFQQRYGIKLGFMSFFTKAVVEALMEIPQVGAQVQGDNLVYYNYYDIGIAVGGGKGLVVPIIRNSERLSFAEIELQITDFGKRAQANKIGLDEMEGGCFTISNGGVYGSLLSTPIVNPPQSGVLGLHNIVDRPVVVDGQIVIRPMMYIAMTYDHRVVDGREAVTFLKRIKDTIEDPTRLILEI